MASSMHALEIAVGPVTREPCKAARDCFLWSTHYISWDQQAGEGERRRMRKPVCRKHARDFAETYGLTLPEGS